MKYDEEETIMPTLEERWKNRKTMLEVELLELVSDYRNQGHEAEYILFFSLRRVLDKLESETMVIFKVEEDES